MENNTENTSKYQQVKSLRSERKQLSSEIKSIIASYKSLPTKEAKREAAKKIEELKFKRKEIANQLKSILGITPKTN